MLCYACLWNISRAIIEDLDENAGRSSVWKGPSFQIDPGSNQPIPGEDNPISSSCSRLSTYLQVAHLLLAVQSIGCCKKVRYFSVAE